MARAQLVAAFAAIYVIWGSTFLAVALGLQSIPPLLLMGVRSIAAGVILLAIEQVRGQVRRQAGGSGLSSGRAWASAAVSGLLLIVGGQGALAYAQQYVPSGLAAVMVATIPFWMVLLNMSASSDLRARMLTLAGLLPGLAGVALIAWPQDSRTTTAVDPWMIALLLASAFFWAAGSVVSQRLQSSNSTVALSGMQLVCGGAASIVGSAVTGELGGFSAYDVSTLSWAGLSYLIGAGSVVTFTAYMWLLDNAPGALVNTYTFVNPIIAVILGWRFLGERPTPQMLAGTVLVIVSVIVVWRLTNRAPRRTSPRLRGERHTAREKTRIRPGGSPRQRGGTKIRP
jgi:drug/metabolite transporter (DMT)-like permease